MTTPRFAELAARLLGRDRSDAPTTLALEHRAEAIALMEEAMRRRRRVRSAIWTASAAAAIVLVGVGARRFTASSLPVSTAQSSWPAPSAVTVIGHPSGSGATVVDTGSQAPLVDGRSLPPGSRIVARADSRATLSLSTGTQLVIEEDGDLSILDNSDHQLFALGAGSVRAQVAKLADRARFIVNTPDAEVEVRGTSFRVAIVEADPRCEGGTVTRVSVDEGVVSVRHAGNEAHVAAGQRWPSGCVALPESPSGQQQASVERKVKVTVRDTAARPTPARVATVSAVPPATTASDLAEQNDAFAAALAAKRRGETRSAVAAFERFAIRYPSSTLVESALAQRMELLRATAPEAASSVARQYLARYPKGFARAEAEAIQRSQP